MVTTASSAGRTSAVSRWTPCTASPDTRFENTTEHEHNRTQGSRTQRTQNVENAERRERRTQRTAGPRTQQNAEHRERRTQENAGPWNAAENGCVLLERSRTQNTAEHRIQNICSEKLMPRASVFCCVRHQLCSCSGRVLRTQRTCVHVLLCSCSVVFVFCCVLTT